MDKIICDICGSSYPETEEVCPICGCSKDVKLDLEPEDENFLLDSPITSAKKVDGKYSAFNAQQAQEALEDEWDEDDDDYEEDDDDEEESHRGRTSVVILLTIVIMLLLCVCGFLFVRYLLPNMGDEPAETEFVPETQAVVETTTEPGIPCEQLIMMSGASLDLTREGEYKLINVMVKPEDTTDKLEYSSADETIATVNAEGRVTAVSEGDTVITIRCGNQKVECRIFVRYVEETEPPTEETEAPTEAETVPEEQAETAETEAKETEAPETQPEETTAATTGALKDVTLKLGKNDFSMGVGYEYTIPLACDLEYDEIEWSTGNANVATIEDGVITTHGRGTTQMFARYGDQEVTGWIRVK